MEFIGGTETIESAPTLSTAKRNGFSVSRLKFVFQKIFEAAIYMHRKDILQNDLNTYFSVLCYIFMRRRKCENIHCFLFTRSDL